jgi:L-alanine-DL-glutamate epimerase-like enolase superfamily enzyme
MDRWPKQKYNAMVEQPLINRTMKRSTDQRGYDMIEKPCGVSFGNRLYYTFVKKPVIEAILVNVFNIHLDFGGASSCLRVGQMASNSINTR